MLGISLHTNIVQNSMVVELFTNEVEKVNDFLCFFSLFFFPLHKFSKIQCSPCDQFLKGNLFYPSKFRKITEK